MKIMKNEQIINSPVARNISFAGQLREFAGLTITQNLEARHPRQQLRKACAATRTISRENFNAEK
jgi:hypothetical protein